MNVILVVGLLSLCVPAGTVAAKPVTQLEVDVWLDKGGEGPNVSGGEYEIGETPTIYFTATIGCNTRLSLTGPDGTRTFEQPAMYGPVYQLELGVAEGSDVGQWQVVLEAATSTGDQYATDMTSFAVIGPEPEPSPPSTPGTPGITPPSDTGPETPPLFTPPTLVPSDEETASASTPGMRVDAPTVIGPKTATAVYALLASKMASGATPVDLDLDADGDGQVTSGDARLILGWAVDGQTFFGMTFDPERLQVTGEGEDGQPTWVYNYPRQEVVHGVFLEKSLALVETSSGYGKEIVLTFVNENDTPVEFWHTEVIPKSVAAHVDDISFSRQPDVIIDPDPSFEFLIVVGALTAVGIPLIIDPAGTVGWMGGFVSQPFMEPSRFDKLDQEDQCEFIRNALGPHVDLIKSTAGAHDIPPSLLGMVILNELIDYGVVDQGQEHIPNLGSSGIAQINVQTAIEHNLVDVTQEEMDACIARFGTVDAAIAADAVRAGMEWVGFGSGPAPMTARQLVVWEKLNEPKYAIEAAAREIDFALNRINSNLDKTWGSYFLEGPIDRNDIYANIKVQRPNETDPDKMRLMQKQAMALMVCASYNSPDLPLTTKPMTSNPYGGFFDDADHYKNGVLHGHWAAAFVETLERCLPLDEEEDTRDMSPYTRVNITANLNIAWQHTGVPESDALGSRGERHANNSLTAYGEGRWLSPTEFAGSWDYVEESMMYGDFLKQGQVSIVLDPDDPNHILSFRIVTIEAPERAEPRKRTTVIEGGNVHQQPGFSEPFYTAFGEDACRAITTISGTKNEFGDGSWSDAMQFSCTSDTSTGLIIEFQAPG